MPSLYIRPIEARGAIVINFNNNIITAIGNIILFCTQPAAAGDLCHLIHHIYNYYSENINNSE